MSCQETSRAQTQAYLTYLRNWYITDIALPFNSDLLYLTNHNKTGISRVSEIVN